MAKTSKARLICYDYIAHIQRGDGTTVEISGTRAARSKADVYNALCRRAIDMKGHLVTQNITESDKKDSKVKTLPSPAKNVVEAKKDDTPYVFDNTDIFGTFTKTYTGATAVTFRPRSEE